MPIPICANEEAERPIKRIEKSNERTSTRVRIKLPSACSSFCPIRRVLGRTRIGEACILKGRTNIFAQQFSDFEGSLDRVLSVLKRVPCRRRFIAGIVFWKLRIERGQTTDHPLAAL